MTVSGPQIGVKYTLTGPDGSKATFNDSSDADYVGVIEEITGLDSPEVRENAENITGADGAIHGNFYYGRRPITLAGKIFNVTNAKARNEKLTKLAQASNAMRADALLTWTPEGGEEQFMKVRRAQPLRITGAWVKDFQLLMVSADPRIYATKIEEQEFTVKAATGLSTEEKPTGVASFGKHVYVTSAGANKIKFYKSEVDGTLSLVEGLATGAGPQVDVISSDGKNVYTANSGAETVGVYNRDTTTGKLTAGTAVAAGHQCSDICITENGKFLYTISEIGNKVGAFKRETGGGLTKIESFTLGKGPPGHETTTIETGGVAVGKFFPNTSEYVAVSDFHSGANRVLFYQVGKTNGKVNVTTPNFQAHEQESVTFSPRKLSTGPLHSQGGFNQNELIIGVGGGFYWWLGEKIEKVSNGSLEGATWHNGYIYLTQGTTTGLAYFTDNGTSKPTYNANIGTDEEPTGVAAVESYLYVANRKSNTLGSYKLSAAGAPSTLTTLSKMTVTNGGNIASFPIVVIEAGAGGNIYSPRIVNESVEGIQIFWLNTEVGENEELIIDMLNRTVKFGTGVSAYAAVFPKAEWWALVPGTNVITCPIDIGYTPGALFSEPVKCKLIWRNAWI